MLATCPVECFSNLKSLLKKVEQLFTVYLEIHPIAFFFHHKEEKKEIQLYFVSENGMFAPFTHSACINMVHVVYVRGLYIVHMCICIYCNVKLMLLQAKKQHWSHRKCKSM